MIRIILRSEVDEKHPPSACFAVRSIEKEPGPGWTEVTNIEVSVAQLQEMVRRLWRLLPPTERPCP